MNVPIFLAAAAGKANEMELLYVWRQATPEGKGVIFCLLILSIVAWSVMIAKALQMRRAKKLNFYFNTEYRTQKNVLDLFDRRVQAEGCPLFMVYQRRQQRSWTPASRIPRATGASASSRSRAWST